MNELITIRTNENGQAVSARDLHEIKIGNESKPIGFRIINGYDNLYCINPFGDIVSPSYTDRSGALRMPRIIIPIETRKGYLRVALNKNGIQRRVYVHRLVAETFIENKWNKPQVNHIDGDKKNNHVSNLEWCTNKENIVHSYKVGLRKGTNHVGERNTMAKLTEEEVTEIINSKESVGSLSYKFKISTSCIYKIRQRKRWGHL